MGSVKDLKLDREATPHALGQGKFIFSDRYSVFDWGEMPDMIQNKGAALCLMGAYCFEEAEKQGIATHYRGVVDRNGNIVKLAAIEEPSNTMAVSLVTVVHPKFENGTYDYSMFTPERRTFLIPLEIIYRNGLPESSSIFRRLEAGEIHLDDLGLDHYPRPGEVLERPIFDVSTKLEEKDRYITWQEAKGMAGLSDSEVHDIKTLLFRTNDLISQIAKKTSLVNEDGKIELAFDPNRKLMVVDVIGTLDECRFTYGGIHVSKEIARQYYKNTKWYRDVENAKRMAEEQKTREWKKLCPSQPEKLPPELKGIIEDMYTATANAFLGKDVFDAPALEEVVKRYERFIHEPAIWYT